MNLALVRRGMRDALPLLIIVTAGIVLFETLFISVVQEVVADMAPLIMQQPFIRRMVQALVGADFGENITLSALLSVGFAHPVLYAFTWAFIVTIGSRLIAGEVDRGTSDLLLTLPVSRTRVYVSATVILLLAGILLSIAPVAGIRLGAWINPPDTPVQYTPLWILAANLAALYLWITAATLGLSANCSRRGTVVAIVIGYLITAMLLSFLGQLSPVMAPFNHISVLKYYQTFPIIRSNAWPIGNLAILIGGAVILWTTGLILFRRRDIPAA